VSNLTTFRGVTEREFRELWARRLPPGHSPPRLYVVRDFLERCCALGFLVKETGGWPAPRYYPTAELTRALGWDAE
jgi:hypothetical protein